jgi:hypothetical protein
MYFLDVHSVCSVSFFGVNSGAQKKGKSSELHLLHKTLSIQPSCVEGTGFLSSVRFYNF